LGASSRGRKSVRTLAQGCRPLLKVQEAVPSVDRLSTAYQAAKLQHRGCPAGGVRPAGPRILLSFVSDLAVPSAGYVVWDTALRQRAYQASRRQVAAARLAVRPSAAFPRYGAPRSRSGYTTQGPGPQPLLKIALWAPIRIHYGPEGQNQRKQEKKPNSRKRNQNRQAKTSQNQPAHRKTPDNV
jgi:hypothetical protein